MDYVFCPDDLVTLPASELHNRESMIVEECTGCGLGFIAGEEFFTFLDHGRGHQAYCEVCYCVHDPHKVETMNLAIATRLILREIRKNAS